METKNVYDVIYRYETGSGEEKVTRVGHHYITASSPEEAMENTRSYVQEQGEIAKVSFPGGPSLVVEGAIIFKPVVLPSIAPVGSDGANNNSLPVAAQEHIEQVAEMSSAMGTAAPAGSDNQGQ